MKKVLIVLTTLACIGCGKSTLDKYYEFSNISEVGCIQVKLPQPIEASLLGKDYVTGKCPAKIPVGDETAKAIKVCDSFVDKENDDPNVYTYTYYNKTLNADGEVVKVSADEAARKCEALLAKVGKSTAADEEVDTGGAEATDETSGEE